MTQEQIIEAWAWVRKNNNSIPDDVLDFMKDSAIAALQNKSEWISVEDMLLESDEFIEGVKLLIEKKPRDKSLLKAAEELNELSTAILKAVNKNNGDLSWDILEELVDVQMHLLLLQKLFKPDHLRDYVYQKVAKMIDSKEFHYYKSLPNLPEQ